MMITIDVPIVSECSIADCAYNTENMCHAKAITIGDSGCPCCDTMDRGSQHVRAKNIQAGVGACKSTNCSFNSDMECAADSIIIGMNQGNISCMTFSTQ
ncbi:MAG: DUF1540 domain-containing protein [Gammaproteobacteria bacterium]|nr:DUF1540 domain-containing protein [Gammaproteobacteria bacterium]